MKTAAEKAAPPIQPVDRIVNVVRNKAQIISGLAELLRHDHKPGDRDYARAGTIQRTCQQLVDELNDILKGQS